LLAPWSAYIDTAGRGRENREAVITTEKTRENKRPFNLYWARKKPVGGG